ncbi:HindVP family restriction endonuclease [Kallipyga gabonensis]|uniref:HindVP family restriction endonuclease n=1 Tax=Kallipyga gabonensis TaxID=1686287 RepID=UPI0006B56DB4|nr:HindVP family restriction endonuclease [Kallipyga gabonensis]
MSKKDGQRGPLLLFGLDHASHDFTDPVSLGKNIFTNAFPISIAQYLALRKGMDIPLITADIADQKIVTKHTLKSWREIIETDPESAIFKFEEIFQGFNPYTNASPNKSDIVVSDASGKQTRAFEVKLVVVPNSQTADRPHDKQSCEIVVRPPSIEQLAFSIADSYGAARRTELLDIITDCLKNPMDYQWSTELWMRDKVPKVVMAANEIVRQGIKLQTPFALTAIWRTKGQKPVLEDNAFDIFAWTDMAFLQLFIDKSTDDVNNSKRKKNSVTRPERSLIWLISALFDYAAQRTLNFSKHHSKITYDAQTDKAGAFAGDIPLKHLNSPEFRNPRIQKAELESIVTREAFNYLMPERRLDSAIMIQHLLNSEIQEE